MLLLKFSAFSQELEEIVQEICGVRFVTITQFDSSSEEGDSFSSWIIDQIQRASKVVCLFSSLADLDVAMGFKSEVECDADEQQRLRMAFQLAYDSCPMKMVVGVFDVTESGCALTNYEFPVFELPKELYELVQELRDQGAQDKALRTSNQAGAFQSCSQQSLRLLNDTALGVSIDLDLLEDMYGAMVPIWD